MPEHGESLEAQSLRLRWDEWSQTYRGEWIAIYEDRVIANDQYGDRLLEALSFDNLSSRVLIARMTDPETELG